MKRFDDGTIILIGIILILLCLASTFPLMVIAEFLGGM